jgi:hypothetical protein
MERKRGASRSPWIVVVAPRGRSVWSYSLEPRLPPFDELRELLPEPALAD